MKGLGLRFAGISEGRLGADPIQTEARGHKSFPTDLRSVVNWHHISTTTGKHPKESENRDPVDQTEMRIDVTAKPAWHM
jgi:hypothetical protein